MSWIETCSGTPFHFDAPEKHTFRITDIAHSLSMQCRFCGHTRRFYSIAEHSLHVAGLCPTVDMFLLGLLHDATEAYLGDVTSPLKARLPDYRALEKRVEAEIYRQLLGFCPTVGQRDYIHKQDRRMLGVEARELLVTGGKGWSCLDGVDLPDVTLECKSPEVTKAWFLEAWRWHIARKMEKAGVISSSLFNYERVPFISVPC